MSLMPRQKYRCQNCGHELWTRATQAYCWKSACNFSEMEPWMPAGGRDKRGKPLLGCLVLLAGAIATVVVLVEIFRCIL